MTSTPVQKRQVWKRLHDTAIVRGIFVLLLLIGAISARILLTEAPDGVAGSPHPDFPRMFVGADKGAGQAEVLGQYPLLLLCAILGFIASLIHLGIPENRRSNFTRIFIYSAFLLQCAVVAAFWFLYQEASLKGWSPMAASFPVPTAIFLYLTYPVLCLYGLLYVVKFKTLMWPAESEAAFNDLLDEMNSIPEEER